MTGRASPPPPGPEPFSSSELPASTQSSLSAYDPGVIDFYFAAQRLAAEVHHRTPKLVEHHPRRFVVPQPQLPLSQDSREATPDDRTHTCQWSSHGPPKTRPSGRPLSPMQDRSR